MRLLLLSASLKAVPGFLPAPAHIAFFPTGGEREVDPWWVTGERRQLVEFGYHVSDIDLDQPFDGIKAALDECDAIYVSGGNTYYILHRLRDTGTDRLIVDQVSAGKLYMGCSAGAVLCGPSIEPIAFMDDRAAVPGLTDLTGFGLVDFVVLPHYGVAETHESFLPTLARYQDHFRLVLQRDDEAILVTQPGRYEVIRS